MKSIDILLADDDKDDRLIFKDALAELSIATKLTMVNNGEQLMEYLSITETLPDVLFLDVNMPRKNGMECLVEIKRHALLKKLPVIIYSTSYDREKADQFYNNGAQHFICKPADYNELKDVIYRALSFLQETNSKSLKENFVITNQKSLSDHLNY